MVRHMLTGTTISGLTACTCPLCGMELTVTLDPSGIEDSWRSRDLAEGTVLGHLLAAHEPLVEHSPVIALGALVQAGAGTLHIFAGTGTAATAVAACR